MRNLYLFIPILLTSCNTNDHLSSRLIMKPIILALVAGISVLIKNYVDSKQQKKSFEVKVAEKDSNDYEIVAEKEQPIITPNSVNIIQKHFGAKHIYWRPIVVGVLGLICIIIFSSLGEILIGFLFFLFFIGIAIYMNKEFKETHQEYHSIDIHSDRITLLPKSTDVPIEIIFQEIKSVRLENIYESGAYGIYSKTGCNIIFINKRDKDFFSFDYTHFENSSKLKNHLFNNLGL